MYATQSDIVALYGEDILHVADRDGDGVVDVASVDAALADASAEVDSYLAVRYALPLPEGTNVSVLRRITADIAIYSLAQSRDILTEELRRRYEDALKALMRLSSGQQTLIVPATPDPDADPDAPIDGSPRPVVQDGPERLFSRDQTRRF